jgi:FkbM family methyltransferase
MSGISDFLKKVWYRCAPSFPIPRTVYGKTIYFDLRDNPAYVFSSTLESGEPINQFLTKGSGIFWDVGCNVGIFSIRAATLGYKVIAFDISSKALTFLEMACRKNHLTVERINRAFSTTTYSYAAPKSAKTDNKPTDGIEESSISFIEASERFGMPNIIKMDIEGGESEFINSKEFKKWIFDNKICWIVEIHDADFGQTLEKEFSAKYLGDRHFIVDPRNPD